MISECLKNIKMFKLVGGSPLSQGLPPLENSPLDCFQFTPCPSSSKTLRLRRGGEEFRALRGATKGLLALWTSRQLGSAGSAVFGRLRRPLLGFFTNLDHLSIISLIAFSTASTSARNSSAETRNAPFPKIMICSAPSEVATRTR